MKEHTRICLISERRLTFLEGEPALLLAFPHHTPRPVIYHNVAVPLAISNINICTQIVLVIPERVRVQQ